MLYKEGGAPDQLSNAHEGMDRFRIKALIKLIKGNKLNNIQREQAFQELHSKCKIYGNGCLKRGKRDEGGFYLSLPARLLRGENVELLEDYV